MDREIIKGFLDGLRPIKKMDVSEWADKYRYLSPVGSAEPGLWRTGRTPYLKEIMDMLSSHNPVQRVVTIKGAQLGFTEAGNNWIGYIIDNSPAPTLMVMPTDDTVKRNSKIRIDPMVESSPKLKEKIKPARSRDSGNTTYQKEFPGGVLVMTGANSAVGLRSMPVRNLFLDEVDGYPQDLDGEGSPIDLAVARTRTFANRKILIVSTPTIESISAIEREFLKTDQRRFFVPCPYCEHKQYLKFENLKWTEGKPETAHYHCEDCGVGIEERHKTYMLAEGKWVATAPENESPILVGYHINSLYSPYGWYSWVDAAREYEEALKDPQKMKTFVNTVLGETWKDEGEAPAWEAVYNKREAYHENKPTNDVAFITAGVDVQKNRLELEVVGWCRQKRSYSLDYRVLMGNTAEQEVWDALAKVVNEVWTRPDGLQIPMGLMAVDTGYNTQMVYDFCRRFDSTKVIPVKGQDEQATMVTSPRFVDVALSGKKVGRIGVWHVGVSLIKSELYGWLRLQKGEDGSTPYGYCHFPQRDANYFKGLTAEQMEFRLVRGFRKYQWVKKFDRNEPLDCRVYARAAAEVFGISRFTDEVFEQLVKNYNKANTTTKATKKRTSDFW